MSHRSSFFSSVFVARYWWITSFALGLGISEVARAQSEPPSGVAAELFDAGLELLEVGRHAEACSKLEASQRLDPQVGTLMYWAYCLESQGLTPQARDRYREAEALARERDDERQETARQRAAALELQLSEVTEAPPEPLAAEAPQAAAPIPSSDPGTDDGASALGTRRTIALVAGSVGIVGLGVGTVFGLQARSIWNEAERRCPDRECAQDEDRALEGDARSKANVATVAVALGGAALAGGIVLWLTAPSDSLASAGQGGGSPPSPTGYRVLVAGNPGGVSLALAGGF